jgi:signal transduction histidine kinase
VAQLHSDDILADFAHRLRQPLSALEALTAYLDLITAGGDPRIQEQLRRMHGEISLADQILRDGLRALRPRLAGADGALAAGGARPQPEVAEELTRPLTNAAMATVTY